MSGLTQKPILFKIGKTILKVLQYRTKNNLKTDFFSLGKNKAMRPGELVCVAYSGGTASTSLVHLLKVSFPVLILISHFL